MMDPTRCETTLRTGKWRLLTVTMSYIIKIGSTFRKTKLYAKTFYICFTIMKQQDTLGNSQPIMPCDNITGGPECAPLSSTTYLAVASANSSKSTAHRLTLPFTLSPALLPLVLLLTVLWT